jgi:glycosyltransferase involved in cell wall biosynthesis
MEVDETLNVCLISPDFIPSWSGIGTYVISLLQNLPDSVRVHLVTVKREIPGSLRGREEHHNSELFNKLKDKTDIHFIARAKGTFFYHLKFQSACSSYVPILCKKNNIDLIHGNFPVMSDIQVKMFRRLSTPSVTTVHSTIEGQHFGVRKNCTSFSRLQASDMANLILYFPLKICEFIYSKKTQHFIAVSENMKRELQRYLRVKEEKIRTIHNGVDTERFSPDIGNGGALSYFPSDRPVVLFTGRFVATKGINILVDAIPKVVEAIPKAFFMFVGGGDYKPYQSYLESHGVDRHNFLFKGYIPESELPKAYSSSTLYVAPTIYEPLGIRILEAMSCGLPVVASKVGGIPEIISDGQTGFLIHPNDSKALSERIIELLNDEDLAHRLGRNARTRVVEEFSDKKMARKTLGFYRQVLDNN